MNESSRNLPLMGAQPIVQHMFVVGAALAAVLTGWRLFDFFDTLSWVEQDQMYLLKAGGVIGLAIPLLVLLLVPTLETRSKIAAVLVVLYIAAGAMLPTG